MIEFIKRKKDKPFFLMLTYNAPHSLLDVKARKPYQDSDLLENNKAYAGLITHLDEGAGRLVQAVNETGFGENTVIIFTSDNGGSTEVELERLRQNAPLREWKAWLCERRMRVPLIIKIGDQKNASSKSDFPSYFPDLFATLVEVTGSHTTQKTDGISLLPEIEFPNGLDREQRFLYWEQYPHKGIAQAVRWGD